MTKKAIAIFVSEVILFWILWFIYGYTWVNSFNNTADALRIITFVGMIIIILTAIIVFVIIIRESIGNVKILPAIIFIIFVAGHLGMYLLFSNMGNTNGGVFNIAEKMKENGKYYLFVKEAKEDQLVKIECEEDIYEELIIDENVLYTFSYRSLSYNKDIGVLEGSIDTKNITDSR